MFVLMLKISFLWLDGLWGHTSKGWVKGIAGLLLQASLISGLGIGVKLELAMPASDY